MTHIWITLHVVVHLMRTLAYHIHWGSTCSYWVGVRGSRYHGDCIVGWVGCLSFLKNLSYFIFIYRLALVIKLKFVLWPTHSENFEAIYFWNKLCRAFRQKLWELLKEYVWETCSEVRSIYIQLFLPGDVHVLASGTIYLHSWCWEFLRHSNRKYVMPFTKDARTIAKGTEHILLLHHG